MFNHEKKFKAYVKSIDKVCEVPEIYFSSNEVCVVDHQSSLAPSSVYNLDDVILLQHIGLFDEEGQEVYEGDIVKGKTTHRNGNFEYCGVVSISTDNFTHGVTVTDVNGGGYDIKQLATNISVHNISGKVIGNVFENPELIGGFSGSRKISNQ